MDAEQRPGTLAPDPGEPEEPIYRETGWHRFTRKGTPYFFIIPAVVMVFLVLAYPVGYGVYLSTLDTDVFGITEFVGFQQYIDMYQDPIFLNALWRTGILVVGTIIIGTVFSLIFALVLDKVRWGGSAWRAIVLVPYLISGVAAAVMWRFLFSPTGGMIDPLFVMLGIEPMSWLGHPVRAMLVLILANVWFISPFATLIIYAGLKTVDQDMYEAADVDGANANKKFLHITMPSIAPQFGLALVWLSFASFNMFDIILPLTGGGPARATDVLALILYQLGFQQLDFNGAAVIMVTLLLFNVLFSSAYLLAVRSD
jgi:multiple sugar transport system permease protein